MPARLHRPATRTPIR
ncbi:hypothetical protein, partial [Xanthomonas phaseoli]